MDFASQDTVLMDLEDSCKVFVHFEGVPQGGLDKESTGTGTGNGIGGKGVPDKINTEGVERNRRQSFDAPWPQPKPCTQHASSHKKISLICMQDF